MRSLIRAFVAPAFRNNGYCKRIWTKRKKSLMRLHWCSGRHVPSLFVNYMMDIFSCWSQIIDWIQTHGKNQLWSRSECAASCTFQDIRYSYTVLEQRKLNCILPIGHMTFIQRRINVDTTSWRFISINAKLYKRHVPATAWHCIDLV